MSVSFTKLGEGVLLYDKTCFVQSVFSFFTVINPCILIPQTWFLGTRTLTGGKFSLGQKFSDIEQFTFADIMCCL